MKARRCRRGVARNHLIGTSRTRGASFPGSPTLLLWHPARLIALIRRKFRTAETDAQYRALWGAERAFLCERLNIRWLVSAADTLAEHDRDTEVRALVMMPTSFANTIKLQESERHVCNATTLAPDPARIAHVQDELPPLFEGMSCFTVGTDDTLRNMRWRLQVFVAVEPTGAILKTVTPRSCRMSLNIEIASGGWLDEMEDLRVQGASSVPRVSRPFRDGGRVSDRFGLPDTEPYSSRSERRSRRNAFRRLTSRRMVNAMCLTRTAG